MWREGFDLEFVAWLLNALALLFGAALGARGLLDPKWAARFVRLKADEAQAGGFAEFRATYGGVFFALHAVAFAMTIDWILAGESIVGLYAAGAAVVIAAAWAGSAGGRALSMLTDGTRTRFNMMSAGVEALMALLVALPWLVWVFQRPG